MDSFAGVGHHFDLAALQSGERVLDLGSGSGLDSFVASLKVGATGTVVGIDMTVAQLDKANELRQQGGFSNVEYVHGYIDQLPFEDESFDVVISNGVINLVADKDNTFKQAARVLKRGGRLALSDIVTGVQLPQGIVCDATLWAACIGGHPPRQLPASHRRRRPHHRGRAAQPAVPIHQRPSQWRDNQIRSAEHLARRREALTRPS